MTLYLYLFKNFDDFLEIYFLRKEIEGNCCSYMEAPILLHMRSWKTNMAAKSEKSFKKEEKNNVEMWP
jgi:hypothetical protein